MSGDAGLDTDFDDATYVSSKLTAVMGAAMILLCIRYRIMKLSAVL